MPWLNWNLWPCWQLLRCRGLFAAYTWIFRCLDWLTGRCPGEKLFISGSTSPLSSNCSYHLTHDAKKPLGAPALARPYLAICRITEHLFVSLKIPDTPPPHLEIFPFFHLFLHFLLTFEGMWYTGFWSPPNCWDLYFPKGIFFFPLYRHE